VNRTVEKLRIARGFPVGERGTVALLIVIAAGIAIYGLLLRLFGVTGWREAVNAVKQSGPPDLR